MSPELLQQQDVMVVQHAVPTAKTVVDYIREMLRHVFGEVYFNVRVYGSIYEGSYLWNGNSKISIDIQTHELRYEDARRQVSHATRNSYAVKYGAKYLPSPRPLHVATGVDFDMQPYANGAVATRFQCPEWPGMLCHTDDDEEYNPSHASYLHMGLPICRACNIQQHPGHHCDGVHKADFVHCPRSTCSVCERESNPKALYQLSGDKPGATVGLCAVSDNPVYLQWVHCPLPYVGLGSENAGGMESNVYNPCRCTRQSTDLRPDFTEAVQSDPGRMWCGDGSFYTETFHRKMNFFLPYYCCKRAMMYYTVLILVLIVILTRDYREAIWRNTRRLERALQLGDVTNHDHIHIRVKGLGQDIVMCKSCAITILTR